MKNGHHNREEQFPSRCPFYNVILSFDVAKNQTTIN